MATPAPLPAAAAAGSAPPPSQQLAALRAAVAQHLRSRGVAAQIRSFLEAFLATKQARARVFFAGVRGWAGAPPRRCPLRADSKLDGTGF